LTPDGSSYPWKMLDQSLHYKNKINVYKTHQLLAAICAAIYHVMQPQCQSLFRADAKKAASHQMETFDWK
ncbi:MAG: hypothetical protein ACK56I_02135, partial [bacterium]